MMIMASNVRYLFVAVSLIGSYCHSFPIVGVRLFCTGRYYHLPKQYRRRNVNIPFLVENDVLTSLISSSIELRSSSSSSQQHPQSQFPLDWSQDSRINIRNLLTQRSVQSFLYLCESVRDPHSGKWIQDFFDCPNQLEYHGTGANYVNYHPHNNKDNNNNDQKRFEGDGTWDGPLLAMIEQPKDVVIVSAKRRGAGHGGWSKNNVSHILTVMHVIA
jgi:hypothetical protein